MNRYRPRSPGARLSALRRALWEEDRAWENVSRCALRPDGSAKPVPDFYDWAGLVLTAGEMTEARKQAERELWEAKAGHGLD